MTALRWHIDGADEAPPLVLLNSIGATGEMWTPLLAPLAERFRVIRIDHPGHGLSPAAPRRGRACELGDLAADIVAVLDELALTRVDLAGLSIGGMLGMWLGIHRPERINRLALLCTSAHLGAAYAERARVARADGMGEVALGTVQRWLTEGVRARDPELAERARAMIAGVDPESYAQLCEAIATMDLRPDLGRIAAPTMVIAGDQDPATPPDAGRAIADGIAGARLEVVGPAAHVATFEQPGAIAQLLVAHFGARASGEATRRAVLGDAHVDRALTVASEFTSPFQDFITRYAWGDVWTRPGLGRRERSIATLAALVSVGAEHELGMHVRAALRNGLTSDEIGEILLHTAVYAGVPRANRAFTVADEVLRDADC